VSGWTPIRCPRGATTIPFTFSKTAKILRCLSSLKTIAKTIATFFHTGFLSFWLTLKPGTEQYEVDKATF
jgi:hypothetical protein